MYNYHVNVAALYVCRVFLGGEGRGGTKLLQLLHVGALPGSMTFWAYRKVTVWVS